MARRGGNKPKFGFNPKVANLKVTKLEIAQREIDTAADLYFSLGDLVSTHLLASAAHEILEAYDKAVLKTGMLFDHPETAIKEQYLDEYRELMKRPYVGFKHGKKDLDAVVELPWGMTDMLLFSAVEKYTEITKRPTAKMMLLKYWISVQHRLLTAKGEQNFDAETLRKRFPPYARQEFREEYHPLCKIVADRNA